MIKPRVLLHICCAPCSIPVIKFLEKQEFSITGFWYNPNIWPEEEYEKRIEALIQYEREKGLSIIYKDQWQPQENPDPDSNRRCLLCYEDRLSKIAQTAEESAFDFFTTTLLVSPYQKHELIRDLALDLAQDYGINFYYEDFRPLFAGHKKEARELGLYQQRYCGCKASIKEAERTREEQRKK